VDGTSDGAVCSGNVRLSHLAAWLSVEPRDGIFRSPRAELRRSARAYRAGCDPVGPIAPPRPGAGEHELDKADERCATPARARARGGGQRNSFCPDSPPRGGTENGEGCLHDRAQKFSLNLTSSNIWPRQRRACHYVCGTDCADFAPVALAASGFLDHVPALRGGLLTWRCAPSFPFRRS
jgi:hypothetical protein